jgi:sialic acid synthase SpsE
MVKQSKEAGAWAAKFQLFNDDNIKDSPLRDKLEPLILTEAQCKELVGFGRKIGIEVFFTPMYLGAVDVCERVGVNYYKIRCKDNQNENLIDLVDLSNKMFFISYDTIPCKKYLDGVSLFCVPKYPALLEEYHTGLLGYSDHTSGVELIKREFKTAKYIEKHCCLSKPCLEGAWSITFGQLREVLRNNNDNKELAVKK